MALVNRNVFSTGDEVASQEESYEEVPEDILTKLEGNAAQECMFCGKKDISEKLYGLLYERQGLVAHYFCLLFASRLPENGSINDGIWGFLLEDIQIELIRASREICTYCQKPGATIRCCERRCRKVVHLPCGLNNGSMHQYFGTFKSFCKSHRVTQNIDLEALQHSNPVQCSICTEDALPDPALSIWAPCCRRNSWFHRNCIQDMALNAGALFKCPLCNNVEAFKERMLDLGIYIPLRKSSWGAEPTNSDTSEQHSIPCGTVPCGCPYPEGRDYNQEIGPWQIRVCFNCGLNGTHILCSYLHVDQQWACKTCCSRKVPSLRRVTPSQSEIISISSDEEEHETPQRIVYVPPSNSRIPLSTNGYYGPSTSSQIFYQPHNQETVFRARIANIRPSAFIDLTSDDD